MFWLRRKKTLAFMFHLGSAPGMTILEVFKKKPGSTPEMSILNAVKELAVPKAASAYRTHEERQKGEKLVSIRV